jgi:hypothetical protein
MSAAAPIVIIVAALLAFAAGAVIARKRGYKDTGDVIARCGRGHLFETVWVPRPSIRMFHLGWARIQRCPVKGHLSLVRRADGDRLTPQQKKAARKVHDQFTR